MMSTHQDDHKLGLQTLGKFWTAANVLSMIRMLLVVPIAYMLLTDGPLSWTLGLILLAVLTDWFDGSLARWSKTVSEWGKILDPVADKIAASVVVLALVIKGVLPVWFLALIALRDILIVIGSAVAARKFNRVLMSIWMGKAAVFLLSLTVLGAILDADTPVMQFSIWITSVLLIYSFFLYVLRMIRLFQGQGSKVSVPLFPEETSGVSFTKPSVQQKADAVS